MTRLRVLLLSPFVEDEKGARHSDIRALLEKHSCSVRQQRTSGSYAIHPDSGYPGAVDTTAKRSDQTPQRFITEKLDRQRQRTQATQQEVRGRVLLAAHQLNEVDCVVAEVTTQCLQLGMLIERAKGMGLPVLCVRRAVVQLPLLPLIEEDPRVVLCDVSVEGALEAAVEAFLANVTYRGAKG